MKINILSKNNPNRWFLIKSSNTGEESIKLFGNGGEQNVNKVETGQPVLLDYLTETELETKVNDISGIADYYKDSVETESGKFQGPSSKY